MRTPSDMATGLDGALVLDALEGTAWITDSNAYIVSLGLRSWDEFAGRNSGEQATSAHVLHRRLFDFISPGAVRQLYEDAHQEALNGGKRIVMDLRCDAPETERRMRLSLGRLTLPSGEHGVLYHAQTMSERARPPFRLLTDSRKLQAYMADSSPIVALCSFCGRVRDTRSAGSAWVEPETYYAQGGSSKVRLSHGVCPKCEASARTQFGSAAT